MQKANEAVNKPRRAKKTRVRLGGPLTIGDAQDVLAQKEVEEQVEREMRENGSRQTRTERALRRCGKCGKSGHNARTCQGDVGMFDVEFRWFGCIAAVMVV